MLIGPLGTNVSEILTEIDTFSFKKMHLKMSSGKWRSFVSASMCYFSTEGVNTTPDKSLPPPPDLEFLNALGRLAMLFSDVEQLLLAALKCGQV